MGNFEKPFNIIYIPALQNILSITSSLLDIFNHLLRPAFHCWHNQLKCLTQLPYLWYNPCVTLLFTHPSAADHISGCFSFNLLSSHVLWTSCMESFEWWLSLFTFNLPLNSWISPIIQLTLRRTTKSPNQLSRKLWIWATPKGQPVTIRKML